MQTHLARNKEHVVIYHRSSFSSRRLLLRANHTVDKPPGHAEFSWDILDNDIFIFRSQSGDVTAELVYTERGYEGRLLGKYDARISTITEVRFPSNREMEYLLCIPYVNRPDLLQKAIAGVAPVFSEKLVIIDNSDSGELANTTFPAGIKIFSPCVPLTFTQSQNLMQRLARERCCDVLFSMHSDGEVTPCDAKRFIDETGKIWRHNPYFGVIFTNYDVFCAFNLEAVRCVGKWDTVFTQYYADNDYYQRIEEAGFDKLQVDIPVNHVGSATLHSDPNRIIVNDIFFPAFRHYLASKRHR